LRWGGVEAEEDGFEGLDDALGFGAGAGVRSVDGALDHAGEKFGGRTGLVAIGGELCDEITLIGGEEGGGGEALGAREEAAVDGLAGAALELVDDAIRFGVGESVEALFLGEAFEDLALLGVGEAEATESEGLEDSELLRGDGSVHGSLVLSVSPPRRRGASLGLIAHLQDAGNVEIGRVMATTEEVVAEDFDARAADGGDLVPARLASTGDHHHSAWADVSALDGGHGTLLSCAAIAMRMRRPLVAS
jgi:hypothetical protein